MSCIFFSFNIYALSLFAKGISHHSKFFQHCFIKAVTGLWAFDLSFYEPGVLETLKVLTDCGLGQGQ